jgi:hypothetical protein
MKYMLLKTIFNFKLRKWEFKTSEKPSLSTTFLKSQYILFWFNLTILKRNDQHNNLGSLKTNVN